MNSNIETYVNQLPTHKSTTQESDHQDPCTICLESTKFDSKVLACGHKFHSVCLIEWIKNSSTCPSCRLVLPQFAQNSSQARTSSRRDRSVSRRRNQTAPRGRVRSTSRRRNQPSQSTNYVPTTDVIVQRRSLAEWREDNQTLTTSSNESSCIIS